MKHFNRICALALTAALSCAALAPPAGALETLGTAVQSAGMRLAAALPEGKVSFTATAPDASGRFDVVMTMDDVSFVGYQFALRYDPDAAVPVDSSGKETSDFDDFAQAAQSKIYEIGTDVNGQTGFFEFSGFIMPETTDSKITDGAMSLSGDTVYTFHFKKTGTAPMSLEIAAVDDSKPYQKALPSGAALLDFNGDIPSNVVFDLTALSEQKVEKPMPKVNDEPKEHSGSKKKTDSDSQATASTTTASQSGSLIEQSVILQLGNYGAVVKGMIVRIDPADTAVQPYAKNSRTYVPVRFLAEQMGATVGWDEPTQTVTITRNGKTVSLVLGQLTYTADGVQQTLDAPVEVVSQRTMVPIRFVSEALGLSVQWEPTNQLVLVMEEAVTWNASGTTEQNTIARALELLAARDFIS